MSDNAYLKTCLNQVKDNHSLPADFYKSERLYALDLEHVYYKSWLFAIPACEIPNTGDYVTQTVGDYAMIIVRGQDGIIRAFHNSCRHRGSRVCAAHKGNAPKLVCPYHQWTYELDGQLLYARDMGEDFDATAHGLKTIHCRTMSGLVYISLAQEPDDFDVIEAHAEKYFNAHDLESSKVAHESTIIEKANWKLVLENNRECYHCSGSHPSLCRTYSDEPVFNGISEGDIPDSIHAHWQRCEAANMESKFMIEENGTWRFARMPLMGGAESLTLSGKTAVNKLMGNIQFKDAGTLLFFYYPNSWHHFLSDHAVVFRITPLNAFETEVTTKWLVHKDAVEDVDYDIETLTRVWIDTNDEDRQIVQENQIGVRSPAYEPGPYSPIHELGVIQFIEWYRYAMSRDLDEGGKIC